MSNVLELATARAAKEAAIEQVDANADAEWKEAADEALRHLAETRHEFTADDVWELIPRPRTPSALGPAMRRLQGEGIITPTDKMVPTRDATRHRHLRVWRSGVTPSPEHLVNSIMHAASFHPSIPTKARHRTQLGLARLGEERIAQALLPLMRDAYTEGVNG